MNRLKNGVEIAAANIKDPEIFDAINNEALSQLYGWTEKEIEETSVEYINRCIAISRGKNGNERTEIQTDGGHKPTEEPA